MRAPHGESCWHTTSAGTSLGASAAHGKVDACARLRITHHRLDRGPNIAGEIGLILSIHFNAPFPPRATSTPLKSSAGRIWWQMLVTYRVTYPGPDRERATSHRETRAPPLRDLWGMSSAHHSIRSLFRTLRRPAFSHEVLRTHRFPTAPGALLSTGTVAGLLWSGRRVSKPPTVHCV